MDTKTGQIEVVISAIDGDYFILEDLSTGKQFYWPIKNLENPIKVGNKLTLELKPDSQSESSTGLSTKQSSNEQNQQEEQMHRLLEALVN